MEAACAVAPEGNSTMSETFSDQECVVLYLGWRLDEPLACPACGAHISSRNDAKAGWVGSRRFTCDGCGKIGTHLVPDPVTSAPKETPADPGPSKT
jgi:hypothetical protein